MRRLPVFVCNSTCHYSTRFHFCGKSRCWCGCFSALRKSKIGCGFLSTLTFCLRLPSILATLLAGQLEGLRLCIFFISACFSFTTEVLGIRAMDFKHASFEYFSTSRSKVWIDLVPIDGGRNILPLYTIGYMIIVAAHSCFPLVAFFAL